MRACWSACSALTLLAGIVSGLAPALMAARADLNGALKSGGRGASGEPRAWFRSALVVGQVALSLMLLVSGGLFVRSLDHVRQVELGFDPQNVVVASAVPSESGYDPEQRSAYFTERARSHPRRARRRARRMGEPGFRMATVSDGGPFWLESRLREPTSHRRMPRRLASILATSRPPTFRFSKVARSPIATMRRPTPVAIVNQTLATQFWPEPERHRPLLRP